MFRSVRDRVVSDTAGMPIAFDDRLRERMAERLAAHDRLELPLDGRRHAAVAIIVVDSTVGADADDPYEFSDEEMAVIPGYTGGLDGRMAGVAGGASFVLCRRSAGLNTHASQWALPGGRLDADETAVDAALRETWEEVGVRLDPSAVLGLLDDYPTRSGYVMTPVVVWGGGDIALEPNPDEVLATYRIGLHELARVDSPRFVDIPESDRPVVQVPTRRRSDPRTDRCRDRQLPLGVCRRPCIVGGARRRLRAAGLRLGLKRLGRRPSAAGVTETAAAVDAVEVVGDVPFDGCDGLDHELGDAVAAMDLVVGGRVGVDEDDLDLAAVGRVDQSGTVDDADAVFEGHATAGKDEAAVAHRNRDRDPGRHEASSTTGRQDDSLTCVQVEAGVALVGVRGERELRIELDDRDLQLTARTIPGQTLPRNSGGS